MNEQPVAGMRKEKKNDSMKVGMQDVVEHNSVRLFAASPYPS